MLPSLRGIEENITLQMPHSSIPIKNGAIHQKRFHFCIVFNLPAKDRRTATATVPLEYTRSCNCASNFTPCPLL
jgi:hypothetical protein